MFGFNQRHAVNQSTKDLTERRDALVSQITEASDELSHINKELVAREIDAIRAPQ